MSPKQIDWQALLVDGYEPLRKARPIFRRLPRDPRCRLCQSPFGGFAGRVCGLVGRKPSRKNPNLCQYCFDHLSPGGIELDVGVVFADVRSSTALGEQSTPTDFARRLNAFYRTATDVLVDFDAVIDKLIGDEVMALFLPGFAGHDYRLKTANAALALGAAVHDLPVGVAGSAGVAFVGNVGSGSVLDFTALGDAINVGARLQALAAPGEVVLSEDLYVLVASERPDARQEHVAVRGRDAPLDVRILTAS